MSESEKVVYQPQVHRTQEFIEIAYDFSNPLELVREAISNSFDAGADRIEMLFSIVKEHGKSITKTVIRDNGCGMDIDCLHSFFDLGNSTQRNNDEAIGEKGHGTKVYFNSSKIEVNTVRDGVKLNAVMDSPIGQLHDGIVPEVSITQEETTENNGTEIIIMDYNYSDDMALFSHERLKDYIMWFTKMGSIEMVFSIDKHKDTVLFLKGLDKDEPEEIHFGHFFPENSKNIDKLFDEYITEAPKYYCKRYIKTGRLTDAPAIEYQAIFVVEGTKVKYDYNKMIRRPGYTAPKGAYSVQDRYGLWLCKDFIPIQRKNEWISPKGTEFTKFHAFFNCQGLRLTANRGSVDNTPYKIIDDIRKIIMDFYTEITESDDWREMNWLHAEADSENTKIREGKDFIARKKLISAGEIAEYKDIVLIKPRQENGVFSMFMQLQAIEPDFFPFTVIDYDTHVGIDVIVKPNSQKSIPVEGSMLAYVEFKFVLGKEYNHSFKHTHSIICWDINTKIMAHGDIVTDIADEKRTLIIVPPKNPGDIRRYFLDDERSERKIEVFVLKHYLEDKAGIKFRPRTKDELY